MNERWDETYTGYVFMAGGVIFMALFGTCTWNEWHSHDEFAGMAFIGFGPIGVGAWLFVTGVVKVLESRDG